MVSEKDQNETDDGDCKEEETAEWDYLPAKTNGNDEIHGVVESEEQTKKTQEDGVKGVTR